MKYLGILSIFLLYSVHSDAGTVLFTKGDVTINKKPAQKGAELSSGDIIATGAGSVAVVKSAGGNTFKLDEKSSLGLDEKKEGEEAKLAGGSIFIQAKKMLEGQKGKNGLMVRARSVSMGVRGTQFFVSEGKSSSDDVWMCVNEGKVVIQHKDEKKAKIVNAGEGVSVLKGKTSKPKPLPWTKKLNWNFDPVQGDLENKVSIEEAYSNPAKFDYD